MPLLLILHYFFGKNKIIKEGETVGYCEMFTMTHDFQLHQLWLLSLFRMSLFCNYTQQTTLLYTLTQIHHLYTVFMSHLIHVCKWTIWKNMKMNRNRLTYFTHTAKLRMESITWLLMHTPIYTQCFSNVIKSAHAWAGRRPPRI